MGQIKQVVQRDTEIVNYLLAIWESSVKATHTFLSVTDIESIKPEVKQGLVAIEQLYCFYNDNDIFQGFIGVAGEKVEMLFISANTRGQGIGKQLLNYAINNLNVKYVDVNEQNIQGVGFYNHMGFRTMKRSALDGQGRPFPILHLERNPICL